MNEEVLNSGVLYDELFYHLNSLIDNYKILFSNNLNSNSKANKDEKLIELEDTLKQVFSSHIVISFEEYIKYRCCYSVEKSYNREDLIGPSRIYLYLIGDDRGSSSNINVLIEDFYRFIRKIIIAMDNLHESLYESNKETNLILPSIKLTHDIILEGKDFKERLHKIKSVAQLDDIFEYAIVQKRSKINTNTFCEFIGGMLLE